MTPPAKGQSQRGRGCQLQVGEYVAHGKKDKRIVLSGQVFPEIFFRFFPEPKNSVPSNFFWGFRVVWHARC